MDVRLAMAGVILIVLSVLVAPLPFQEVTPTNQTSSQPQMLEDRMREKGPIEVTVTQAALIENPLDEEVRGYIYMAVPVNCSHQESYLASAPPDTVIQYDDEGNPFLVVELVLGPREVTWVNVTVRVRLKPYVIDWIAERRVWPPLNVTLLYTGRTRYWDTYNLTLRQLARDIAGGEDDPVLVAKSLASWITTHLEYHVRFDRLGSNRAVKAGLAKLYVYGDCTEVADVYVTLSRILGLPARTAYGMMRLKESEDVYWANFTSRDFTTWTGHVWPQVYIPPWGWVDIEMLEGGTPKVGDYSWRHVVYGFESRKFMGSDFLGAFCRTSFGSEPLYLEVKFSPGW